MSSDDRLLRRPANKQGALLGIAFLGLLLGTMGCRENAAAQLEGAWIGRPAAASVEGASGEVAPQGAAPADTDFGRLDAAVKIVFLDDQQVELQLVGSSESIRGQWEVVEATPGFILIEIITPADAPAEETDATLVRRRFELEPTYEDDRLVRFLLREDGADRKLGFLKFQRASDAADLRREVKVPVGQSSAPSDP